MGRCREMDYEPGFRFCKDKLDCSASETAQVEEWAVGASRVVYLSNYSPVMPAFEGGGVRNFMGNSQLTTGVLVPGVAVRSNSLFCENEIARSTSVPGLSDLFGESSMMSSRDDKHDGVKEDEALVTRRVVYGEDMATQMSPEGSTRSSSKGRLSFSTLPSSIPNSLRPHSNAAAKDEIRDVQVDKGTTTVRQLQREEAKITAWENLQKAKAEAAIRKLEMKLEKKKSASMDRIMNKLRAAQMKAEAMRNLLSENRVPQAPRNSHVGFSCCVYVKACSVSNSRRN
ncbi:hypothetical protein DH2020_037579 [Rehmannia glutinosa]|uniref:Remorin C-terminal domain-containing protein n=1 Tax=Rehmannia glutinosa TaxID=99300 RepID=A0ABR0V3R5_REHGL